MENGQKSLGQKVHPQNWNQNIGYVRGAPVEARLINNAIDAATLKIWQLYVNEPYVTADMVKQAYRGKCEKEKTLMEVMDFVIERFVLKVEGQTVESYAYEKEYRQAQSHLFSTI